jgi:hypothetical protein
VRGPGKSQDETSGGEGGDARVAKEQSAQRRNDADGQGRKARAHEVKDRADERDAAEELQFTQLDDRPSQAADHARQTFGTSKLNSLRFDDEEAQIQRIAECDEAEQDQEIGLARRREIKAHALR